MKLAYILLNILIFTNLLQLKLDWKANTKWNEPIISSQTGNFDSCSIYSTSNPENGILGNAKLHVEKSFEESAIIIEVIKKDPQSFLKIANVNTSSFCFINDFLENNLGCLLKVRFDDLIYVDLEEITNGIMLVFYFKTGEEIYEGKIIFDEGLADGLRQHFINEIYKAKGLLGKRKEFLNKFSKLVEKLDEAFRQMLDMKNELNNMINRRPSILKLNNQISDYQKFFSDFPGLLGTVEDFLKKNFNQKYASKVDAVVKELVNGGSESVIKSDKMTKSIIKSIVKSLEGPLKNYKLALRTKQKKGKILLVLTNYLYLQKCMKLLPQEREKVRRDIEPEEKEIYSNTINRLADKANLIFSEINAMCYETSCTSLNLSNDENSENKVRRLNEYINEEIGKLKVAEQAFEEYRGEKNEKNEKIVFDNSFKDYTETPGAPINILDGNEVHK
jgi:hypothetical protein